MKSELIVDVQPKEVSIALLEDGRLVSLQKENRSIAYAVGDIYVAKVKKLMPGLNAAFVNVGYEKDAFLHYLDLGPRFSSYSAFLKQVFDEKRTGKLPDVSKMKLLPDIDKHGTITDHLTCGDTLMVQIVKEPISSKGPRLTTEITFTGRYMVLIPFSDKISISQKIKTTAEKLRLRHLVQSIRPKNFGVIIRTSAEGKSVAELNHELNSLHRLWEETVEKARTAPVPSLIFEEESRIVGVLRDIFSPTFEDIHVNDKEIMSQIKNYVNLISPEKADIVKLYDKDVPIFDHFNITRQIKSSFGKTVSFKSGAYIIIEHTEALHVIDVNSGNRAKAGTDQETNALDVNIRAADEIARQLRLRDMGGIIVVDFIDMAKPEHRQALYEHMREVMATDRARHNILPLSKFGLMQITRKRVRPALDIVTTEACPSCFGKQEVQPSLLFTDVLKDKITYLVNDLKEKNFIVYVHPFVDAYLKKGLLSPYRKWKFELGGGFKIMADESLAYLQYRVLDKNRNEIDLKEEKDLDKTSSTKTKTKTKNRAALADLQPGQPDQSSEPEAQPQPQPAPKKPKAKPQQQAPKQQQPAAKTERAADSNAENAMKPANKQPQQSAPKAEKPQQSQPAPRNEKRVPKQPEQEPSETDTQPDESRDTAAQASAQRKPRNRRKPAPRNAAPVNGQSDVTEDTPAAPPRQNRTPESGNEAADVRPKEQPLLPPAQPQSLLPVPEEPENE